MPRPTAASARARTSQLIDNLWDYAMVDDNFENVSIPGSKLADLSLIDPSAGVIPSANIPPAADSIWSVSGTDALIGNDQSGNARGTEAIDISTDRGTVAEIASGNYSVLVGRRAQAATERSIAIGNEAQVRYGVHGVAIGAAATVGNGGDLSTYGIAIGSQAAVLGAANLIGGIAIGRNAQSWNLGAISVGQDSDAQGGYSVSLGMNTQSPADSSVVIGQNATNFAGSHNSVCIGPYAVVGQNFASLNGIAIGSGAQAHNPVAITQNVIAIGVGAQAQGYRAIAIGQNTLGQGDDGIAIGYGATATAAGAIAIGAGVTSNVANEVLIGVGANVLTINGTTGLVTVPLLNLGNVEELAPGAAATHKVAIKIQNVDYFMLVTNVP